MDTEGRLLHRWTPPLEPEAMPVATAGGLRIAGPRPLSSTNLERTFFAETYAFWA